MRDALELELRQLPGVSFVSFSDQGGATFIDLVVGPGTEHAKVREEAARCVVNHLEGPAKISVYTYATPEPAPAQEIAQASEASQADQRVKLVMVLPSDGGAAIEVQLSRGSERSSAKAVAGDTAALGRAVLEALRSLGAQVPFDVIGFHALPADWGSGLLAVLRDTTNGELRRGVASGRSPADAAARAVLAALNRSL
jgi:hypothetical protein